MSRVSEIRATIKKWQMDSVEVQAENPELIDYVHNYVGCTLVQELSDADLVRLTSRCSASLIRAAGYKLEGKQGDEGKLERLETAISLRVRRKFGPDATISTEHRGYGEKKYRGFKNITEIREFYNAEMKTLITVLLVNKEFADKLAEA